MTDENLGDVLDESYRAHQRTVAIKNLGERTHLTLGQIAKLVDNPKHGEIVATITLEELLEGRSPAFAAADADADDDDPPTPAAKTNTKRAAAPKPAAKKTAKKKAAKKKSVSKNKATKTASKRGAKADKGKPKPRLDYEKGMKEVLAALKAAKEPVGRSAIEKATGFTGVQVRAFCKKLKAAGKVNVLGEGGRSTMYEAA